jgi:hypothetical protein
VSIINPWSGSGTGGGGGSLLAGPSVAELFASFQALFTRAVLVAKDAAETRTRLEQLRALGAQDQGGPKDLLPSVTELERALVERTAELATFGELLRGVETGTHGLRPSQQKRFDLDIVPLASDAGGAGLGLGPLVVGLASLGRMAIALGGMYLADRGLKTWETHRLSNLVEQGKDISKLVVPPATLTSGIASITTPIALAAVVVGIAMLMREWKQK